MSLQTIAAKFVEMCKQGQNFDVMRTLYSPDIVSVEPTGAETAGQQQVIDKSAAWIADKSFDSQTVAGPFICGPDQFAVHFVQKVTPKATGQQETREEIGVYTVRADKITREQFFV